jgi:hypothetical protein
MERARNNNYAAESFIQQYETPAKMPPAAAIAPGAPVKREPEHGEVCEELSEVIRQLDGAFINEENPSREADCISEITDEFCEERRERKPRYVPVDVDAPKEAVIEVDYSKAAPVKKRNIKYTKAK